MSCAAAADGGDDDDDDDSKNINGYVQIIASVTYQKKLYRLVSNFSF